MSQAMVLLLSVAVAYDQSSANLAELILQKGAVPTASFTAECTFFKFANSENKRAITRINVAFGSSQNCLLVRFNDCLIISALW
jgi:hypothetical protein